jgi:hypothetical protein
MVSDDAMEPLERLLNLVGLLLASPTPLTFDQIRDTLEAYQGDNIESVKRKFERDKDSLRAYGVPLEMTGTDVWDVEMGYTIPKDRYYLPEISFTPEEVTALYLAAQGGSEATEVAQGVRKLLYGAEGGLLTGVRRTPGGGERRNAPDGCGRRRERPSPRDSAIERHRQRGRSRSMRSGWCSRWTLVVRARPRPERHSLPSSRHVLPPTGPCRRRLPRDRPWEASLDAGVHPARLGPRPPCSPRRAATMRPRRRVDPVGPGSGRETPRRSLGHGPEAGSWNRRCAKGVVRRLTAAIGG